MVFNVDIGLDVHRSPVATLNYQLTIAARAQISFRHQRTAKCIIIYKDHGNNTVDTNILSHLYTALPQTTDGAG